MSKPSPESLAYVRSYVGSIDSTALALAFDAGRRASEWIACSERMPDAIDVRAESLPDTVVLVYCGGAVLLGSYNETESSWHVSDASPWAFFDGSSAALTEVTHWHPLPAPPTGESK